MRYSIGIVCTRGVGPARGGRASNSDNYLVGDRGKLTWRAGDGEQVQSASGEGSLVAISAGVGDSGDDTATSTVVQLVGRLYRGDPPEHPAQAMRTYLLKAHQRLNAHAASTGPVRFGASVTAAWLIDGSAHWVQVGNTRLYLYRSGRLTQLTADHTEDELALREGAGPVKGGQRLAQALILGALSHGDPTLRIDPGLDTGSEALRAGDRLLLCSAGVHHAIDGVSIADVLKNTPEPQGAAVSLMERAVARGSLDNLTALVVKVSEG
ncbi:MAG: hypothetical protein JXX28_13815 [Deltaproteobacteria bacterium]|nr:hypothetical protein [Deltaproteobacteria bacterium]